MLHPADLYNFETKIVSFVSLPKIIAYFETPIAYFESDWQRKVWHLPCGDA